MITLAFIKKIRIFFVLVVFALCQFFAFDSRGEELSRVFLNDISPQEFDLTVGKSIVIDSLAPTSRVSIVDTEIADTKLLSPNQFYLTGKAPGITNLTLWADDKVYAILDLKVYPDTLLLKETLYKVFPEEKDIRVNATHDNVTLSGTISSSDNVSQILALTEPYFPGKVINLMEVSGVQQVMLEVRVAEMSQNLLRRLGINFAYTSSGTGGQLGLGMLSNLSGIPTEGNLLSGSGVSSNINIIMRFLANSATWTIFIDALKEEGMLKVLAEPTLITLSGKSASFLAGGEFPVPVPQGSATGTTTITIQYKPFGVALAFTPVVLGNNRISMHVAPEVSELDFSNAVNISGFVVPSVTTRRVATSIELADGQSFAIAGLLKDEIRENVSKYPFLGDIPILGKLFQSSTFQKNESELIIIVTPHLVKPLDMEEQTLPTDRYTEPNDFEFYFLERIEKEEIDSPNIESISTDGDYELEFEGEVGHITPN